MEFTAPALQVNGPIRLNEPIFGQDYVFLRSAVASDGDGEADHPVAVDGPLPGRPGRHRPGRLPGRSRSSGPTCPRRTPTRSAAIAALGCQYLQLDDTSLAYLNDPDQRAELTERGDDAEHQHLRYIRQINAALADRPDGLRVTTHMCRGNFRSSWAASGSYDFVAEALFSEPRRRRLLPRVRRRAVGRVRTAALRAARKDGRARPGHHQAGRARVQGRAEAAHRRGRPVRTAGAALPVPAVRLLVHCGGQRPHATTSRWPSSL